MFLVNPAENFMGSAQHVAKPGVYKEQYFVVRYVDCTGWREHLPVQQKRQCPEQLIFVLIGWLHQTLVTYT